MSGTTLSTKILRPEKLGPISELLLRIYPDFENNYLPVSKKTVSEILSLHELKMFMETKELQEKIEKRSLFYEYTTILFVKSIKKIDQQNSEIIDDLFEYAESIENDTVSNLIDSVLEHFYGK